MSLAAWSPMLRKASSGEGGLRREERAAGGSAQTSGRQHSMRDRGGHFKVCRARCRPSAARSPGISLVDLVYSKPTVKTPLRCRRGLRNCEVEAENETGRPRSRLQTTRATAIAGEPLLADSCKSPGIESTIFACVFT